jgi:hypothetical protein
MRPWRDRNTEVRLWRVTPRGCRVDESLAAIAGDIPRSESWSRLRSIGTASPCSSSKVLRAQENPLTPDSDCAYGTSRNELGQLYLTSVAPMESERLGDKNIRAVPVCFTVRPRGVWVRPTPGLTERRGAIHVAKGCFKPFLSYEGIPSRIRKAPSSMLVRWSRVSLFYLRRPDSH